MFHEALYGIADSALQIYSIGARGNGRLGTCLVWPFWNIAGARANHILPSSARDQISNQTVAVKKLADPFKSDNIAKHMYREVKLLKQLQHENVCPSLAPELRN